MPLQVPEAPSTTSIFNKPYAFAAVDATNLPVLVETDDTLDCI